MHGFCKVLLQVEKIEDTITLVNINGKVFDIIEYKHLANGQ